MISKTKHVKNNSTFLPAGLFYSLAYWNILFSPSLSGFFTAVENIDIKTLILIVVLLSILLFLTSEFSAQFKKISLSYAMLTSGMLGLTYELLIIFLYQSFYGYVYHHIALLITSFMLGLTLGGWIMMRNNSHAKINFLRLEAGLIIFSLAVIPLFIYLEKAKLNLCFIFFVISAVSGFLVGAEFPLANKLYQGKNLTQTAGILYALDLVGSWVGALVTSVVLIPVIGIIQTCLLLAVIKLSSLLLISRFET
jgi:spermidine synthase